MDLLTAFSAGLAGDKVGLVGGAGATDKFTQNAGHSCAIQTHTEPWGRRIHRDGQGAPRAPLSAPRLGGGDWCHILPTGTQ